jgi:hypothetical protein
METFAGILVLLGLFLLVNWWWLKKLLFKYRLRNLEASRPSEPVRSVYQQLVKKNYPELSKLLAGLSRPGVYELQKYLSSMKVTSDMLHRYASEHENDNAALYLLGANLVDEAWKVRGSGGAGSLGQQQINQFFHLLQEADSTLRKVLEYSPDYVEVYAPLIRAQMGMSNVMESWSLYKVALAIEPGRLDYALAMLLQLTEKWGGNHEEMFRFARSQKASGHAECVAGLLAAAHHEYWQSLDKKEAIQYYRNKDVRNELISAIDAVKDTGVEKDFSAQYQKSLAQNYIALSFLLMEDRKRARSVFRSIGKNYTPYPWAYMDGRPGAAYLRYRADAGAGAV